MPTEPMIDILSTRERVRNLYWKHRDPILDERMRWRAHSFRHITHLLPGHTILELGCGDGAFTRSLMEATRGECPITAVTFDFDAPRPAALASIVEFLPVSSLPGSLVGREFDFIVAHDMLDKRSGTWLMHNCYELLRPGGQVLFYESNPWNLVLRLRQRLVRLFRRENPRMLLSRPELYELLSEVGFIRIFAVFNDFIYAPLNRQLAWLLRNLSIVLENMPGVRTLAGSILIHAQKPPVHTSTHKISLPVPAEFTRAVSVVIPCHNEEMNVGPLVSRLFELFDECIHEVVLVDDNSSDRTRSIIGALAAEDSRIKPVYRTPPSGVGRAISEGLRAATGNYVLSLDCDFQHLLPEVRDLFYALTEGYDVAIGSRFSRHSVVLNYPFLKIVANRTFHVVAQLTLLARFRDVTNNLKLMKREIAERLILREPHFAVNAETGLQPLVMGYRVTEVPSSWIGRASNMGTSSFKLFKAGYGYWRVLRGLWLRRFVGAGPYRALPNAALADDKRPNGLRPLSTVRSTSVPGKAALRF
jgi:dolichol-phosphate mannosyltransferase